jgi:hypothetical protein
MVTESGRAAAQPSASRCDFPSEFASQRVDRKPLRNKRVAARR